MITRIAFRFCFVYFGLYSLTTQILPSLLPVSGFDVPDPSSLPPIRQIVFWTAAHVFHAKLPLVYTGSGSGDKTFDWVLAFCILAAAAAATLIWTAADRRFARYDSFHKWFRLAMRFALASQMFVYGASKAIPVQMPFPYLTQLVEPYGNFSPMGVLWSATGASPAYEIFAGCAEILGGVLLIFPRTTMFGAMVCLADMIQVFVLNMTYDVPVKLFSFHMILLSLFLLAPDFPRLFDFFFRRSGVQPPRDAPLLHSRRANAILLAAQIAFGILLLGMDLRTSWKGWQQYGGGREKAPLYGIWDAQPASPLPGWRRAIFDFPTFMALQNVEDQLTYYGVTTDVNKKTLTLTKFSDKKWKAILSYERPAHDRLTLHGEMDNQKLSVELKLADSSKFLLQSRGFHWIQEYPFNR